MPPDFTAQLTSTIYKSVFDAVKMLFFSIVVKFWYYWLILILLRFAPVIIQIIRFRKAGLPQIDKMSGPDFELYLKQLFEKLGYEVTLEGQSGDYGADLVIRKDVMKIAVQAKNWTNMVGVEAVQEVVAAKAHYGTGSAMVVTNSRFSRNAVILAKENGVELIDRNRLASLILK